MIKKGKIIFITGVCGIGKTAIIPFLKSNLPKEKYDIRDFDERGVPDNVDRKWRIKETEHWLNVGLANTGKNIITVICGFVKPNEIKNLAASKSINSFVCFLDASGVTIKDRLEDRYRDKKDIEEIRRASGETPEQFIKSNVRYASEFRRMCKRYGCKIIDTTNLTPEKVAIQIAQWIKKNTG